MGFCRRPDAVHEIVAKVLCKSDSIHGQILYMIDEFETKKP